MERAIEGAERFRWDTFHVDQVDPAYRCRSRWIEGAIRCLALSREVCRERGWDVTVVVGVSLESSPEPRKWTLDSLEELAERIDWSPPSLYFAPRGAEPWLRGVECRHVVLAGGRSSARGGESVGEA